MSIPMAKEIQKKYEQNQLKLEPLKWIAAKKYRKFLESEIKQWFVNPIYNYIVVGFVGKEFNILTSKDYKEIHDEYSEKYGYRFELGAGAFLVYFK